MRLSRVCYDKAHRCPGWAGGGLRWPKGENRCMDGRISVRSGEHPAARQWRFGRCNRCDVVTWPFVTKRVAPTWLWSRARDAWRFR